MLPKALIQPNLWSFPTSRKRAITRREAAEQQEQGKA